MTMMKRRRVLFQMVDLTQKLLEIKTIIIIIII